MNAFKNKIAYIVPTKDRPRDMVKLLDSFLKQTVKPDQIIIVDGGDKDVKHLVSEYPSLSIDYCRVIPPGLTRQRNAGKKMLRPYITLGGYLDDDIVLEDDANERMLEYFENASEDNGGASFYITNNISGAQHLFKKLFLIDTGGKGVILSSGINTMAYPLEEDTCVEWLSGGATVWRREILDAYVYDENYRGYGHFDDLDFSCQVNLKYKLKVIRKACVAHYCDPIKMEKCYAFAVSDVINRVYFVKKFSNRHKMSHCLWATVGLCIMHFGCYVLKKFDKCDLNKSKGYFFGIIKVLNNDLKSHDTNIR